LAEGKKRSDFSMIDPVPVLTSRSWAHTKWKSGRLTRYLSCHIYNSA
jgi:hypothetical protein